MQHQQYFTILLILPCFIRATSIDLKLDFDAACTVTPQIGYDPLNMLQDDPWFIAKELYEKNIKTARAINKIRIPKIIHLIWLGSPLPEKSKLLCETWKKHHPDWQVLLWTEKEIDEFDLQNKEIYENAKNYGEKSDIARYEILYRMGGLYIDADFECLKPFDIFHHSFTFYTGIAYDAKLVLFNGLIGAEPGHPILKKCIEEIPRHRTSTVDWEIMNRTGPYFFTKCVFSVIHQCKDPIILFPPAYFYPWPYYCSKESPYQFVSSTSYAIHYWHQSWGT